MASQQGSAGMTLHRQGWPHPQGQCSRDGRGAPALSSSLLSCVGLTGSMGDLGRGSAADTEGSAVTQGPASALLWLWSLRPSPTCVLEGPQTVCSTWAAYAEPVTEELAAQHNVRSPASQPCHGLGTPSSTLACGRPQSRSHAVIRCSATMWHILRWPSSIATESPLWTSSLSGVCICNPMEINGILVS